MFDPEEKERNGRSDFDIVSTGRNYQEQNFGGECRFSGPDEGDQRERRRHVGLGGGKFVQISKQMH